MRIGKRLFPYPILNKDPFLSQYKKSTFYFDYQQELVDQNNAILFHINTTLDNETLLKLVEERKAEINIVIECPETMFRKKYPVNIGLSEIKISIGNFSGKVYLLGFIIAKDNISDFKSSDFLDFYGDISFDIEKHDIIATDMGFVTKVNFDPEDNAKKSIFLVIKNNNIDKKIMKIEYDSSKIIINLPPEQWNAYNTTKNLSNLGSIYFSMFAIPALSFSLNELLKIKCGVDTLRLDYKWFDVFAKKYEEIEKHELSDDEFAALNTLEISQKLFDGAVIDAIDEIFKTNIVLPGGLNDVED